MNQARGLVSVINSESSVEITPEEIGLKHRTGTSEYAIISLTVAEIDNLGWSVSGFVNNNIIPASTPLENDAISIETDERFAKR